MSAAAPDNTQHRAIRAVPRITGKTESAFSAARVNFADHPFSQQVRRVVRALYHADKFVADRSGKSRVPAHDLKIGVTDAGHRHPNERLVFRSRLGDIRQAQFVVFKTERFHNSSEKVWSQRAECLPS